MTDGLRSTCDAHARYDRDCEDCRVRRRQYQAAYRSQPKPTKRARPGAIPTAEPAKAAPVAEELAAQLGRLRRMEANDDVYREMLKAADARYTART